MQRKMLKQKLSAYYPPNIVPGLDSFADYQRAVADTDDLVKKMRLAAGAAVLYGLPGLVLLLQTHVDGIKASLNEKNDRVGMELIDLYTWAQVAELIYNECPASRKALEAHWPQLGDFLVAMNGIKDSFRDQYKTETMGMWSSASDFAAKDIFEGCKSDFTPAALAASVAHSRK